MDYFYDVMYLFLDLFGLYCIRLFFYHFLGEQTERIAKRCACYLLGFLLYVCPNFLFGKPEINLVCSFMACLALSALFEGSKRYKFVLSLFTVILGMIVELVGTLVIHTTAGAGIESYVFVVNAVAKLLYLMVIRIACRIRGRNGQKSYTAYDWWLILFIPMGSIYLVNNNYKRYTDAPMLWQKDGYALVCYIVVILAMDLLVFEMYNKLLELHEKTLQTEQVRMQNRYYLNFLEEQKREEEKLRLWKHDIKNYLLGILGLLHQGKAEEAYERINAKMEEIQHADLIHYSGNAVLDSMLNYKLQICEKKKIKVIPNFRIPGVLAMEVDDLAILFGNALDNAMEAVMALEEEERVIEIYMSYEWGVLGFRMQNPYAEVHMEGEKFLSTKKKDGEMHGLGLQSMKKIVEKHQGLLKTRAEGHFFVLEMLLYL